MYKFGKGFYRVNSEEEMKSKIREYFYEQHSHFSLTEIADIYERRTHVYASVKPTVFPVLISIVIMPNLLLVSTSDAIEPIEVKWEEGGEPVSSVLKKWATSFAEDNGFIHAGGIPASEFNMPSNVLSQLPEGGNTLLTPISVGDCEGEYVTEDKPLLEDGYVTEDKPLLEVEFQGTDNELEITYTTDKVKVSQYNVLGGGHYLVGSHDDVLRAISHSNVPLHADLEFEIKYPALLQINTIMDSVHIDWSALPEKYQNPSEGERSQLSAQLCGNLEPLDLAITRWILALELDHNTNY